MLDTAFCCQQLYLLENWPQMICFQMIHSRTFQNGQKLTKNKGTCIRSSGSSKINDPIETVPLCHLELGFMSKLS